jgi:hypothetical protein
MAGLAQPAPVMMEGSGPRPPRRGHYDGDEYVWDEPETTAGRGGGNRAKRPGRYVGDKFVFDDVVPRRAPVGVTGVVTNPHGVVRGAGGGEVVMTVEEEVRALMSPVANDDARFQALDRLRPHGAVAVPEVMRYLGDKAPYGSDRAFQVYRAPETPGAVRFSVARVTVGQAAEAVLYHLVRPAYRSPYERRVNASGPWMYRPEDWRAWWAANADRPWPQVQADVATVVDRYFQQNGTVQQLR